MRRRPSASSAGDGARDEARSGEPRIVVDTCAIIDGRIAEIVESGFIYGTLVVPRFVLDELQHIADSSDTLRRNRGRRGLEILNRMQKEPGTPVEIVEDAVPSESEVDAKLVALARARSGVILTNDFNLNRVAELQGVRVMNINSLANAVKPAVLPGEELRVRVIQEGKEAGQGVGFLDDGTMIVVEGGARHIDKDLDVLGDPRPADGRWPDDLRAATARFLGLMPAVSGPTADAIVVAAGASTRMAGTDKLLAPIGDRPLLAHSVLALAASSAVESIVVVTTDERRDALLAGGWLPERTSFVRGGARRQDSVRAGFDALERAAPDPKGERIVLSTTAPARPPRRTWSTRSSRRPNATGRRSRPCRSARRSSESPATGSRRRWIGRTSSRHRRRRVCVARSSAGRLRPLAPRTGRGPTRPRCWRPVESPCMSCPAIPPTSR